MAGEFEAKVSGLPDLRAALLGIAPKLRKRALRTALAAGARVVRDAAKRATPVIKAPVRGRKPGTVRDAISVRTSKRDSKSGDVGVFVNVRPAKGAVYRGGKLVKGSQRGRLSENDPYYWRWLNWGWNPSSRATGGAGAAGKAQRRKLSKAGGPAKIPGALFLEKGAAAIAQALEVFKAKIGPAVQKLNGGQKVEL